MQAASGANVRHHAGILLDLHQRRRLIEIAADTDRRARDLTTESGETARNLEWPEDMATGYVAFREDIAVGGNNPEIDFIAEFSYPSYADMIEKRGAFLRSRAGRTGRRGLDGVATCDDNVWISNVRYTRPAGQFGAGPIAPVAPVAQTLCERVPSVDTLRFTNSGTEGTLMAIRAARTFTGRPKIAKFEGGYHGAHEFVSVSVNPSLSDLDPDRPNPLPEWPGQPPGVVEEVVILPFNDLERTEDLIRRHGDDLASVLGGGGEDAEVADQV